MLQKGPHLLPRDDGDLIAILEQTFAEEGVEVYYDTGVDGARKDGAEKVVSIQ